MPVLSADPPSVRSSRPVRVGRRQFPWGFNDLDCTPDAPYQDDWFIVLGIQNYCGQFFSPNIVSELLILMCVFTQRSVLREFGMWDDEVVLQPAPAEVDEAAGTPPSQLLASPVLPSPTVPEVVSAEPAAVAVVVIADDDVGEEDLAEADTGPAEPWSGTPLCGTCTWGGGSGLPSVLGTQREWSGGKGGNHRHGCTDPNARGMGRPPPATVPFARHIVPTSRWRWQPGRRDCYGGRGPPRSAC